MSTYCMKEFGIAMAKDKLLVVACEPLQSITTVDPTMYPHASNALAYLEGGGQVIFHDQDDVVAEIMKFIPRQQYTEQEADSFFQSLKQEQEDKARLAREAEEQAQLAREAEEAAKRARAEEERAKLTVEIERQQQRMLEADEQRRAAKAELERQQRLLSAAGFTAGDDHRRSVRSGLIRSQTTAELADWLRAVKLSQYTHSLDAAGYDLDTIRGLTITEVEQAVEQIIPATCGGDILKFKKAIQALQSNRGRQHLIAPTGGSTVREPSRRGQVIGGDLLSLLETLELAERVAQKRSTTKGVSDAPDSEDANTIELEALSIERREEAMQDWSFVGAPVKFDDMLGRVSAISASKVTVDWVDTDVLRRPIYSGPSSTFEMHKLSRPSLHEELEAEAGNDAIETVADVEKRREVHAKGLSWCFSGAVVKVLESATKESVANEGLNASLLETSGCSDDVGFVLQSPHRRSNTVEVLLLSEFHADESESGCRNTFCNKRQPTQISVETARVTRATPAEQTEALELRHHSLLKYEKSCGRPLGPMTIVAMLLFTASTVWLCVLLATMSPSVPFSRGSAAAALPWIVFGAGVACRPRRLGPMLCHAIFALMISIACTSSDCVVAPSDLHLHGSAPRGLTLHSSDATACPTSDGATCVQSRSFGSANYNNHDNCDIRIHGGDKSGLSLQFVAFNTESGCDMVSIDGRSYSGSLPECTTDITADSEISWHTDSSDTEDGWKMCLVDSDESDRSCASYNDNDDDDDDDGSCDPGAVFSTLGVSLSGFLVLVVVCAYENDEKRANATVLEQPKQISARWKKQEEALVWCAKGAVVGYEEYVGVATGNPHDTGTAKASKFIGAPHVDVWVRWCVTDQTAREGRCSGCRSKSTDTEPLMTHVTQVPVDENGVVIWYCDKCWEKNKYACRSATQNMPVAYLSPGNVDAQQQAESFLNANIELMNETASNTTAGKTEEQKKKDEAFLKGLAITLGVFLFIMLIVAVASD